MPKRVNNIFYDKLKFKYMVDAFYRAAKGKRSNKEVILFELNLANNITSLLKDIYNKKYRVGEYRKFTIYEPKQREIWALPFRDRVVHQWYVEEFIKPVFLKRMIKDSYACIEGRGVHLAIKTLHYYMHKMYKENNQYYILKCDIRKFFYNIDKHVLYKIIEKKIKDKDFLELTKNILYQNASKRIGIPIGNYTSQYFANIYLNELDHYIKENLKVKYYVRFMDDFILLLDDKEQCRKYLNDIRIFLKENLKLELNKKTNYMKNKQGVIFCGYKLYGTQIKLNNLNKRKIYTRVKKWNEKYKNHILDVNKAGKSFVSWRGHASHITRDGLINDVIKKSEWIL